MKKTKIIIPALGLLLLSTAASVTGTVAWFSMNNSVTAKGMEVKARAENGIVISNADAANGTWKETADSAHTATLALKPTSTATGATWVHSTSNDANDENTGNDYELLSLSVDSTTGAGYSNDNGQPNYQNTSGGTGEGAYEADSAYYALHSFYVKSSAEALTKDIYITHVKATLPTGNSLKSENLDKALRVLVKHHGNDSSAKVYCPVDYYVDSENPSVPYSYQVATSAGKFSGEGAASKATVTPINATGTNGLIAQTDQGFLANQAIPASSGTPLQFDIYLYFEGEDPNCKSINLAATLDNIQVEVTFSTQKKSA